MTARIIDAHELFILNHELHSGSNYMAGMARQTLRDISVKHHDMVVANVAAMLAKPVRNWTPDNNGSAA